MQADLSKAASAIFLACLTFAASLAPAPAAAQRSLGFGFCAPPYPPKCISDPATYGSQANADRCQEDVNRYLNSVGAYRLCQTQEVERAVRETNGTLQRWKCSLAAKALCQ
ncbi:MAG: hypothetical protein QOF41_2743 [Methylobacteriaceae bacterium]|jgi:hypothetical protein|nr:hypothetical protein [Methylobacteriaceae bacterium]